MAVAADKRASRMKAGRGFTLRFYSQIVAGLHDRKSPRPADQRFMARRTVVILDHRLFLAPGVAVEADPKHHEDPYGKSPPALESLRR